MADTPTITRLREGIAGLAADVWQSIETAPKDGTRIDVWTVERGRVCFVRWGRHDSESDVPFGPEHWSGTSYYPSDRQAPRAYATVTHWRPLPAPPGADDPRIAALEGMVDALRAEVLAEAEAAAKAHRLKVRPAEDDYAGDLYADVYQQGWDNARHGVALAIAALRAPGREGA